MTPQAIREGGHLYRLEHQLMALEYARKNPRSDDHRRSVEARIQQTKQQIEEARHAR
ncbi:hypothetical protein RADP37_05407 (plasmid) [Roseomonas mucosa]|uniref:Uncharacterized protein n=1 Tax=Roseomonas mucosa TaxID=207340 RepID=A0A4Y1MRL6_9PROT|nr:hypothetical protein [Roseomonas mucosa]AWV20330.1 hypothetical protein RADP37_05407 [Roseomonas mucosa]